MWGNQWGRTMCLCQYRNQCGVIAKWGSSPDLGGKTAEIPAKISKLNEIVNKISEKAKGERISRVISLLNSRESIWDSFNKYFSSIRKTKGKVVVFWRVQVWWILYFKNKILDT